MCAPGDRLPCRRDRLAPSSPSALRATARHPGGCGLTGKPSEPGLVSTIVPVYNRPQLVVEAVRSVLDQTYRPIEVLLVDDGSTDETPAVCDGLAAAHSEIRVLHIANGGPGLARECGRNAARGEFLQYLDSDDLLRPTKFELQVRALRAQPECGACYGPTMERSMAAAEPAWPSAENAHVVEAIFPTLLVRRPWQTPAPLLRTSLAAAAGPWTDLRQEEDLEHDARLGVLGPRIARVPEIVAEIRHPASGRASGGSTSDPRRMHSRCRSHALVFAHARRFGLGPEHAEMQHYARELFLLARQAGAVGLAAEARELFELAREASGPQRASGWDFRIYGRAAALLGWRTVGRAACWSDRLRGTPGR